MAAEWIIIVVAIAGGLGGLIVGIGSPDAKTLHVSWRDKPVSLGFFGDIFLGTGGAVASLLIAETLGIQTESAELESSKEVTRLVAFALVAGFAGRRVLVSLANSLATQVESIEKKQREMAGEVEEQSKKQQETFLRQEALDEALQVQSLVMQGDKAADRKDYDAAVRCYAAAVRIRPEDPEVLHGLGLYQAWKGALSKNREELEHALINLDRSFERFDQNKYVLYDRAGTKNAIRDLAKAEGVATPITVDEVLEDLQAAVESIPDLKEDAATDADFDSIRRLVKFKKIIES